MFRESPNPKQTFIVSSDLFKQFCHHNKLIVLGKDMNNKYKERLGDKHLILLNDFLSYNLFITSINLSYNKIRSEGLKTLANILVKNTHIKELILSNNNIDGDGIKYLAEVQSEIHLECLRLNGNKFIDDPSKHIIDLLTNNTKLKYLDLGETNLTNDIFAKIAPAIVTSKLTGLVISSIVGFNFKTYDTAAIARYIATNTKWLTMLYLRKLQLTDSDVETICTGINRPGFKLLDLSCNNISDIGGGYIVKHVEQNNKLEGLFLSHNRLSDGTSYSLSTVVLTGSVSMLDISYNSVSDSGLLYLLDILQRGCGLCILIWGNSIGTKCRTKFRTLHDLGKICAHHIDVTVHVDRSNDIQIDHNSVLDTFRVNYYSLDKRYLQSQKKVEVNSNSFPFHKIYLK